MQGTTENVREETLRLVGSGDADEQREGIEKGLELLERDTGYEQPAGIVTGEITTGRRGRTTVSASLEWKTTGGARRPQVLTLLALDDAAPLLSPREVHKQLRRSANAASNAGDANALDQLLRSAGDWIPVPAEEDDEALWRPTPAMWKQAEQGAGTYHQRRATALNAARADARGLYLERHDPAAQAAACSTDATVALGREAVENLCRNCPPGETGSGILETRRGGPRSRSREHRSRSPTTRCLPVSRRESRSTAGNAGSTGHCTSRAGSTGTAATCGSGGRTRSWRRCAPEATTSAAGCCAARRPRGPRRPREPGRPRATGHHPA